MEKMKETILHFGKPNANGRVYNANDFQMPSQVPVMVLRKNNVNLEQYEQAGSAQLTKKGDETVEADITLSGAHLEFAKSKLEEGFKFVASGEGHVDESGYIREYRMMRIILTSDPANIY